MNKNYLTKLQEATDRTGSIICFGQDPVIKALPHEYASHGIVGWQNYMYDIKAEMLAKNIFPGAFKPNDAYYTSHNKRKQLIGSHVLGSMFDMADELNIPAIFDGKRGDIGTSSAMYAKYCFGGLEAGAITISPYMGTDSITPFTDWCNDEKGKGVYILGLTSNEGSKDIQKEMLNDTKYVYELVLNIIRNRWAIDRPGVGVVLGATQDELYKALELIAKHNIAGLIPGVGTQGGSAKDVANIARQTGFPLPLLRINISSGITHPWYKKDGDHVPSVNEAVDTAIQKLKFYNDETGLIAA